MKQSADFELDRLLFRLGFALRGHAAHCDPACPPTLTELVEETSRRSARRFCAIAT